MTDDNWDVVIEDRSNERIRQIVEEQDWTLYEEEPDPYVYILGLDPGGTTGVAMLRIDSRDDEIKPELVYLHQIPDGRYGFKRFFNYSVPRENVIIVSEKWKERNRKGVDREPQYIEGSMHIIWDDENINYQYPEVKEQVPDEWLKKNNLWTEGKRHQMDALKHAFAYLRNEEHSATIESLGGKDESPMAEPGEAEEAQLDEEGGQDGEDAVEEAMAKAMAALAEAAEEAAQAAQAMAEALTQGGGVGDDNGKAGGPGQEDTNYRDWDSTKEGFDGTRGKRTVGGAFAGYDTDGADEGKVLFEL
jgi:hypothetical protein